MGQDDVPKVLTKMDNKIKAKRNLFTVLLTFVVTIGSFLNAMEDYATPKECVSYYTLDRTGVALECQVPFIKYDISAFNFSAIPSENTMSLTVTCTITALSFESSFENTSLKHLTELRELIFTQCNFQVLPKEIFVMQSSTLNYLTINRNAKPYNMPFEIQSGSLAHLLQLRSLDMADSNVVEFPTNELCPLTNLQRLNLSLNSITVAEMLGFSSENTEKCGISLMVLDLSFNNITTICNGSFGKLANLQFLHLKGNNIEKLETMSFSNLKSLILLDLSQNLLRNITENLWMDSGQLLVLKMSRNAITGNIVETAFQNLEKLIALDLSFNSIETIEPKAVNHLTHLQEFYIGSNKLVTIGDDTFSKLTNLNVLTLDNNSLEVINKTSFNGLTGLTILHLNDNNLTRLEDNLFEDCLEITTLNVSNNVLATVPRLNNLKKLQILDLSSNRITNLDNDTFEGLFALMGISFKNNLLEFLPSDIFQDLKNLLVLNLAQNHISVLRTSHLVRNTKLIQLYLSKNDLQKQPDLQTLENLQYLDISNNLITKLYYGLLPKNLTYLDIRHNRVQTLEDRFHTSKDVKMTVLMAANNQLQAINSKSLPPTLRIVDLSYNNLSDVQFGTFENMPNLDMVDMSYNLLDTFNKDALLVSKSPTLNRPRVFLEGNFVSCDCTMKWLKYINDDFPHTRSTFSKLYASVFDIKMIYCWTLVIGSPNRGLSLLTKTSEERFLCEFEEQEFSDLLCYKQTPNRKICKLVCPERCSCYRDTTWSNVVVYCSQTNQTTIPANIPVPVKTLHLDGNHIARLTNSSFDILPSIQQLYLNGTGLRTIERDSFVGLSSLKELHLKTNALRELLTGTFNGLSHLSVLDLSSNNLVIIEEEVFVPLKSLDTLKLNSNRLVNFPVWTLRAMPSLSKMSLSNNHWSCECDYLESYRQWLQKYADKVADIEQLFCEPEGNDNSSLIPMIAFNASYCFNATYIHHSEILHYMPAIISVTVAFVTLGVISVLMFIYHREMQVMIYSRYGVRLFHRNEDEHDEEKPYDAFVSYSSLDEDFIVNELLPKLERIEFPYHLCLHHRNFMPGAYIMDSILQAVASSKRTILVLSDNFIQSEWCRLEFKSAHHQMLQDRCNRVVVVVLGKIPEKLDPEMKLYMKTNTYLQWGDRLFWEKLYFALPDVPRTNAART